MREPRRKKLPKIEHSPMLFSQSNVRKNLMVFIERKPPGNVYPLPIFLIFNLLLKYACKMMIWGLSQKMTMMNHSQ